MTLGMIGSVAALSVMPAYAQIEPQLPQSQADADFLTWIEQTLVEQQINPAIMSDTAKIYAAQDLCARLDSGETIASIQTSAATRAEQYEDAEAKRLMIVLMDSLLSGGMTYYCPEHLNARQYALLERL